MLGSYPLFSFVVPACDFCLQLRSKSPDVGWPGSCPIEAQGRSLDFWPERLYPLCECSKKSTVGVAREPPLRIYSRAWPLHDYFTVLFVFIDIPGSFVTFWRGQTAARKISAQSSTVRLSGFPTKALVGAVRVPSLRTWSRAWPLHDTFTESFVFIDIPGSFVAFWGRQTRSPEDGGTPLDGPTPRPPDQFAARVATRPYADGAKFREQSQNVYENKGKGQEVRESGLRYGGATGHGLTTFGPSTKMRLGLRALSRMDGFSRLRLTES